MYQHDTAQDNLEDNSATVQLGVKNNMHSGMSCIPVRMQ